MMTARAFFQRLFPPSIHARLFLVTTVLETAVDIAIEAFLLNKFEVHFSDLIDGLARRSAPTLQALSPRHAPALLAPGWDRMVSVPRSLMDAISANATSLSTPPGAAPPDPAEAAAAAAHHADKRVLPVYLAIFVFAHFFQLFLALEGVWNKNTIQIIGLCMFNAAFLVYAVIQIGEIRQFFFNPQTSAEVQQQARDDDIPTLVDVIPIMIGLCEAIYVFLTYYIFREFGWQVFKKIGADRRIKKMYLTYQVFICILKFDYFFFIGFAIQLLALVLQQQDGLERPLTIAAVPITLIVLFMGYFAVRKELRWLMALFNLGGIVGVVYYVYKLVRIYQGKDGAYASVFKSMTVFAALSFLILLTTMIIAIRCWLNFGNGLKQAMDKPPSHSRHATVRKPAAGPTHKVAASLASSFGFGSKTRRGSELLDDQTAAGLEGAGKGVKIEDGYGYEKGTYPPSQQVDYHGGRDARWRESRMSID